MELLLIMVVEAVEVKVELVVMEEEVMPFLLQLKVQTV
jgi:hypothetical protein